MTALSEATGCPIIVVGAGRSGTTMVRETLMQHRDVAGFEYEMNYLWRYGNSALGHDLLTPEDHLNDDILTHIREAFKQEQLRQGKPRILDKTVANVMRLRFIQAVFPDARFLHVIRDGRAVTASAMKRWSAPQSAGYFASKVRTIPISSLPVVVMRYLGSAIKSRIRRRNYRQSWGARWPSIDEDVRALSLAEVCARQWKESVNAALAQKDALLPGSYMEVHYEALVEEPEAHMEQIRTFFQLPEDDAFRAWSRSQIDSGRQDKWHTEFTSDELRNIEAEIGPLLDSLGYK